MTKHLRILSLLTTAALLSACHPEYDMQGVDPVDYYEKHPIENKIESRTQSMSVHYKPGESRLSHAEVDRMTSELRHIIGAATQIQVGMSKADLRNEARKTNLTKMLRFAGYQRANYLFEPSEAAKANEAILTITYAQVVPPRCPDWRRSPNTTFSNSGYGNFKCATTVNLGQMLVDPNDLNGGNSNIPIDTDRDIHVLHDYRLGKDMSQTGSGGASSSSGSSASSGSSDSAGASGAGAPAR